MDKNQRFHITIFDRKKDSVILDKNIGAIVGVVKQEDGLISRFSYAEVDKEELMKLTFSIVREAAFLTDEFVKGEQK